MRFFKNRKSQLSIFIVIGAILILLVTFLIMSANSEREDELKVEVQESSRENFNIYNFQETSKSCLDISTRKALLLLSLRGGVIYPNNNTIEFQGGLNTHDLNPDYVENLDLEMSNLQRFMLPSLSTKNYLFDTSKEEMTQEIEHYITRDFIRCHSEFLNTTNIRNLSYSVVDPSTITSELEGNYSYEVDNLKANNGEIISIYTQDGKILNGSYNSDEETITTNEAFGFDENVVALINDSFSVKVNFGKEVVSSKIITTDSFSSSNNQVDRGDIESYIKTPLRSLIVEFRELMTKKRADRSISFNESDEISNILQGNNLNLRIIDIDNNDNEIFQVLVLSKNDDTRLKPFSEFVGIYKNTAPILNSTTFQITSPQDINLVEEDLYLKNKISHNEYIDNFIHHNKFEPYEDSQVKLSSNGSLEINTSSGFFNKKFYVSDGELLKEFEVNFNLDGTLNNQNSQLDTCFEITYDLDDLESKYDEFNDFIDENTRELNLKSVRPSTNFEWYGVVSRGLYDSVEVTISENSSCFDTNNFNLMLPYSFTLSQTNPTRSVSIENLNADGSINGEPFVVNIGAVDCLGPNPIPTIAGHGSCCDIEEFRNRWESANDGSDFSSLFGDDYILPDGTLGYEFEELYMCPQNPRANHYSNWELDSGFVKTQRARTTGQIFCEGETPILEDNEIITTGPNNLGVYTLLDYPDNTMTVNYELNNDFYPVCKECKILDEDNSFILSNFGGSISIGSLDPSQNAPDGIYLNENNTFRRSTGGSCYDVYEERECQSGIPTWVEKSSTPIPLDTYVDTVTDSEGCFIDETYRESCTGTGYDLISTSSPYDCPPEEDEDD